jgi:transcriptional regulator with XRE-family HTH domain
MSQSTINQRVVELINVKKIKRADMARICKMTHQSMTSFVEGKQNSLKSSALENIVKEFKDIDPYWLLTGEGNMLTEERPLSSECFECEQNKKLLKMSEQNNKSKDKIIKSLERTISIQEKLLDRLDNQSESTNEQESQSQPNYVKSHHFQDK